MGKAQAHKLVRKWCKTHKVPVRTVRGPRKTPEIVYIRTVLARILRRHGYTYVEITYALGYSDHTAIVKLLSPPERRVSRAQWYEGIEVD